MNGGWLLPMATAALLGSAHCIGMCGGLIAVASDGTSGVRERLAVQSGYQAARLASYLVLGAVAGALGRALDLAGQAAGLGKTAAIVAGATMTLYGLGAMLQSVGVRLKLPELKLLPGFAARFLGHIRGRTPLVRALLLGGASALLPCGFLYGFALAGAATGSPLGGALVMAALWVGNLPALLGFGLALSTVLSRIRRHIPLLSAASVFALGVLTLTNRVNMPALALARESGAQTSKVSVTPPQTDDCPCHHKRAR